MFKKFKTKVVRDMVRSTPKTTHGGGVRSAPTHTHISKTKDVVRSTPKSTHPNRIKNLGKFAHPPARLPSGSKIGASAVRTKKRKTKQVKGY
jgi:hypothetical protein